MRALKVIIVILAALILGSSVLWFTAYNPREFHGAGPMRDTGYFSRPRYHAPLGQVPLTTAGTYTMKFSGLPSEHMTLALYVHGRRVIPISLLTNLTTELSVEITDATGRILCSAIDTPAGPDASKQWLLTYSYNLKYLDTNNTETKYWHPKCSDVPFSRNTEYTLRMTIRKLDPRSPDVSMTAILEGGGIEITP